MAWEPHFYRFFVAPLDCPLQDEWIANQEAFIVLFAAGNDGDDFGHTSIGSPAVAKNVITVGATETFIPVSKVRRPRPSPSHSLRTQLPADSASRPGLDCLLFQPRAHT